MDVEREADGGTGNARRWRERRLRSMLRHERMSVAMALAESTHHSAQRQKTATAGKGVRVELHGDDQEQLPSQAAGAQHFCLDLDEAPAAGGSRPDRLFEVRPQVRVQRHTVDQVIAAPMLDVLVPLLLDVFRSHDRQFPEQVIEVPKILSEDVSVRTAVRDSQLAEQLVEVPTIISFSSLQKSVEQLVDIPVPGRGGRFAGLQGFQTEQSSTAMEQIVDIPGGGPQSFRPGQSSSSSSHFLAGVDEGLDGPGEGVLRTFPQNKKIRRLPGTRVRGCTPVSAHPRWQLSSSMRPCRTPSSGCSSVTAASPIAGTDAPLRMSGSCRLASGWSASGLWTRREVQLPLAHWRARQFMRPSSSS